MERRFPFGRNWQRFLSMLNEERIAEAVRSLKDRLGVESLEGMTFLDIGSGSGLFSLAAMHLGCSRVHSFDYDTQSVACTLEIKQRYFPHANHWTIEQGDVLNSDYLSRLGEWDVVYSWGVLHHTGNMSQALENVIPLVADKGILFIAIYNDQDIMSFFWKKVKVAYNQMPRIFQLIVELVFIVLFTFELFFADILRRRNPLKRYSGRGRRGMGFYRDLIDWLGGYPFEVAKPEAIFRFYRDRGFILKELVTCGGKHGCNEFVFNKET